MTAATEKEYQLLLAQAKTLITGEKDWIAKTANLAALLFHGLHRVNFAGVYRFKDQALIVGPFQGMPACVHIPLGKGVCGQAALKKQTQIVANVHQFTGHIACDSTSNSEIVVPIFRQNKLWGVFDFDSTEFNNFNKLDQKYLEKIAALLFN